ncbi:hypothetical protein C5S36_05635, partial [Candidatus Methanophagaceae archaeon]
SDFRDTNCYDVHKGLREPPDVAKRGRISPVAALMFSGTKRKKTSSG